MKNLSRFIIIFYGCFAVATPQFNSSTNENSYLECVNNLVDGGVEEQFAMGRCRHADVQDTSESFKTCKIEFKRLGFDPKEKKGELASGWCYRREVQENASNIVKCVIGLQAKGYKPADLHPDLYLGSMVSICASGLKSESVESYRATTSPKKTFGVR